MSVHTNDYPSAPMQFEDRRQAGRVLAERLASYAGMPGLQVLALPRGGVPIGFEVARALGAPLDVYLVRKLGVPGHEEAAMGAISEGGVRLVNQELVRMLGIDARSVHAAITSAARELARRERLYRGTRPGPEVSGRTVVLVDDGLATGSTMLAAVSSLRERRPARIVVGVPVAAPSTCAALGAHVDDIVCALTPEQFDAVGLWYADFHQTSDSEVSRLLDIRAREWADMQSRSLSP